MFGKKENNGAKRNNNSKNDLKKSNDEFEQDKNIDPEDSENDSSVGDEKIAALEEENKKLKESLMRTLAELDNTRKRANEENEKTSKYAIGRFAEDLIPVMENFYMALDSIKDNGAADRDIKNFIEGIRLTQNELKKAFDKNGLVRLFPLNEDFDPDLHEAIVQIETDGSENKVMQVIQAGYKIKDRLLRPAMVGVSKKKS